ncbi:MAG: transglycosylase domain-containing protein, partial [Planktothrix sp.]|uniref:transglycosylase domain-containing protein n=1 Tax=Planktothrix sp. TaxID=3088171 RepID=UPI0038D4F8C9
MEESQLPSSHSQTDSTLSETEWENHLDPRSTQPVLTSSATVTEPELDQNSSGSESQPLDSRWHRRAFHRLNAEWVKLRQGLTVAEIQGKRWYRHPGVWIGIGVISVGGGALGYGAWQWYRIDQSLPKVSVNTMASFSRDGTVTIKAANGDILMQTGPATREKLRLKQIPEKLVQAFISTEDIRFYDHDGVDYQG